MIPSYSSTGILVKDKKNYDSNCETTLSFNLDMSAILAADLLANHYEGDASTKEKALEYVTAFYNTIRPLKGHVYDSKVSALSYLYGGLITGIIVANTLQSTTTFLSLFTNLLSFVLKNKDFSFGNYQYSKALSTTFFQMVTASFSDDDQTSLSDHVENYKNTLIVVNLRFKCISNKFNI